MALKGIQEVHPASHGGLAGSCRASCVAGSPRAPARGHVRASRCCAGVESTTRVCVGRSKAVRQRPHARCEIWRNKATMALRSSNVRPRSRCAFLSRCAPRIRTNRGTFETQVIWKLSGVRDLVALRPILRARRSFVVSRTDSGAPDEEPDGTIDQGAARGVFGHDIRTHLDSVRANASCRG